MRLGDCREVLRDYPDGHFSFVATDPPYNVHLRRTMCTGVYDDTHANRRTDYDMKSEEDGDIANLDSFDAYLEGMREIIAELVRVHAPRSDMADTNGHGGRAAADVGFVPKGEKIWYQSGTRLRPYGYPFAYVPNIAHQYIVIVQKPK